MRTRELGVLVVVAALITAAVYGWVYRRSAGAGRRAEAELIAVRPHLEALTKIPLPSDPETLKTAMKTMAVELNLSVHALRTSEDILRTGGLRKQPLYGAVRGILNALYVYSTEGSSMSLARQVALADGIRSNASFIVSSVGP